jgi:hypothetical protein
MNKKINFWLFGISILLLGISISLNISNTVITNESIVLIFIGVLATFIVVGNFAQVSEIRNTTDNKINGLEQRTETHIKVLKGLIDRSSKSEKETYYVLGEAYRLYGIFAMDKELYRTSTNYLILTISLYLKSKRDLNPDNILEQIVSNLETEKWNNENSSDDFDYDKNIEDVREFPESYKDKSKIISLLEKYKKDK